MAAPKRAPTVVVLPSTLNGPVQSRWIVLWFFVSTLIVLWDAGFCLLRPRSLIGGDLHWIWRPYALYESVDLVYSTETYKAGDPFTSSQAILNLIECVMNFIYVCLAYRNATQASVVGIVAATCTFWKTVLYWLMDQQCGWCQTGHNSRAVWWGVYAATNGFWLIVPAAVIIALGREIAEAERAYAALVRMAATPKRSTR